MSLLLSTEAIPWELSSLQMAWLDSSYQRQIATPQADLYDKSRYISTLERRLLQARRSSHSRMSMGLPKAGKTDPSDLMVLLHEDRRGTERASFTAL